MVGLICRRTARTVGALGCLGALLWWAAGSPTAVIGSLLRYRPADFDELLANIAGALAWVCLGWFSLVVALHACAVGSGSAASVCRRLAGRIGPRFMLGGARWLVGVTLLAGPLTAGVAAAAQPGGSPPPASSAGPAAVLNLDRPLLPNLDRPLAPANAAKSAPSPAPTSVAARRSSAAPLLTGTPHRETTMSPTTDDGYVVRPGDTLWGIAARHLGPRASDADIARAWPRWYAANQAAIGPNPALIHPGLVLHTPVD